jgi:hypothetical protein
MLSLTRFAVRTSPQDFTGYQSLRWGGKNGTQIFFNGTYVTGDRVVPKGSMW